MADSNVNKSNHHVCGNCDTSYDGNFCPECGQSKADINRPFSVLLIDLLGNMYAFDTRVLKTLKSVLYKPGEMALDYVSGKRVRYMPPFRFYIFISLIFFLLLNYSTVQNVKEGKKAHNNFVTVDSTKSAAKIVTDTKTLKLDFKQIKNNPEKYITKFYNYLSWSLFILMPFYGFLTWLFFRKNQRHYLAHLIFSISQHTFIFIIFIVLITISLIFPHKEINPEDWLILLIPLYSITGSKKLFQRKWRTIILRHLLIWFLYFIFLIFAIVAIAYLIIAPFAG